MERETGIEPATSSLEIGYLLEINTLAPMALISDDRIYGVFNNLQTRFFVGAEMEQKSIPCCVCWRPGECHNFQLRITATELSRRSTSLKKNADFPA
jgi:hypothetical protein